MAETPWVWGRGRPPPPPPSSAASGRSSVPQGLTEPGVLEAPEGGFPPRLPTAARGGEKSANALFFAFFFCTFHFEPFFCTFCTFLHFFALVSTALSELFSLF